MKRTIEIDASSFENKYYAHKAMKEAFADYEYYGSNLDALHDVLTSIGEATSVTFRHYEVAREKLGAYAESIIRVFEAATAENDCLEAEFCEENDL